jgi:hypothetical protein
MSFQAYGREDVRVTVKTEGPDGKIESHEISVQKLQSSSIRKIENDINSSKALKFKIEKCSAGVAVQYIPGMAHKLAAPSTAIVCNKVGANKKVVICTNGMIGGSNEVQMPAKVPDADLIQTLSQIVEDHCMGG